LKLTDHELKKKIAQNTRKEYEEIDITFEALRFAIYDTLQDIGSKVYVKNIGVFELKERKSRPYTLRGKTYNKPAKRYVSFTASKNLKDS
jgi:nucleoid DNA-binding protein